MNAKVPTGGEMIDNDIRTYLLTQSPITALVGTDAAGSPARISPSDRREGVTADSIVYERVSTDHAHNLFQILQRTLG